MIFSGVGWNAAREYMIYREHEKRLTVVCGKRVTKGWDCGGCAWKSDGSVR